MKEPETETLNRRWTQIYTDKMNSAAEFICLNLRLSAVGFCLFWPYSLPVAP
jgi:hypothetical protein